MIVILQLDKGIMKKTIIRISKDYLAELLHFPVNVEIDGIFRSDDDSLNNTISMILSGDDLPDYTEGKVGDSISQSEIIYTKTITNEIKKVGE